MKRVILILAIAVMGVSVLATTAAAQGPAGAGAGAATASEQKSARSGSHSYNPIKWIKKDKKQPVDTGDQARKLTARLQAQGIVAGNADVNGLCTDFKELESCLAALHASHTLGLNFVCVKASVTGVRAGADAASCKMPNTDKPISLSNAIKLLKPDADAKGATKDAENLAKQDLKETAS